MMDEKTTKHLISNIFYKKVEGSMNQLFKLVRQSKLTTFKDEKIYNLEITPDSSYTTIEVTISDKDSQLMFLGLGIVSILNEIRIMVGKELIIREVYNSLEMDLSKITNPNYEFLKKVDSVFLKDFENEDITLGDIIIKNSSYLHIDKKTLNVKYCHKYSIYYKHTNSFIISTAERGFKRILNDEISNLYTMEIFGKKFSELNKKELNILRMYIM